MSRQGGWLKQAPLPKRVLRVTPEDPFTATEAHINGRMAARIQRARKLRTLTQLSTRDLERTNRETLADRTWLRAERRKALLARIADAEAKGEMRNAEALRWHLRTYLGD